ncbi:hypothetical protein J2Y83_003310 [Pseudomonas marginalis]|uniref:hypothetical protein n=1 Tax=Pseudomonas TaxID=286 RepID=UPI00209CD5B6|nr:MULTISPECIES: hypothetical protein [Pseudomonas]MCP1507336.1 hypothetical protein [Pseudomonas marginalis]MCP1524841.1 hypothetical protein [Pseudomonas marginalis]MDQ0502900.1 hypothetical protein [Pseudomonas marginalis]
MNSSSKAKSKATSGTASAIVERDDDYKSFEGARFFFYLDEKINKWYISAGSANDEQGNNQIIVLLLPDDGNVEGKTYDIVSDPEKPGAAYAFWAKAGHSFYQPYSATGGSVTVTLNKNLQTVELTFEFDAEHASAHVSLTQGKMQLEGFTRERKTRTSSSMKCDLSQSINGPYQSTETALRKRIGTGGFPDYLQAWSQQLSSKPDIKNYQISINIANDLTPGTYSFHPNSNQVRIFFSNLLESITWLADKGEIKLESIPDFTDLTGKLLGEFNFEATAKLADGSVRLLKVENGIFDMEQEDR